MGRPLKITTAVGLIILVFGHCFEGQDFSKRGPFSIDTLPQKVTILPTATDKEPTKSVELDVVVTFPTSGAAPFPVVIMFNGFQAKARWYATTAAHVASWGYVVVQYTSRGLFPIVTDAIELGYLQPLLDWLAGEGPQGSGEEGGAGRLGALRGLPDTSRLATMGHSRGGKLAALHLAGRADVATAVLVDPIDTGSKFAPEGPDYPSAVKALATAQRTAGLVGAGIIGRCNPEGSNYPAFFQALAPGSWQMVVRQAGHMQFARTGNPAMDWALDKLCCHGNIYTGDVIADANTFSVAWLESTFREQQSQEGLAAFRLWMTSLESKGDVAFTTKTATTAVTVATAATAVTTILV